ncbi:hypothetical protein DFR29_107121 [Tahibacter aquaticus]|uniref:Trypsin-like peptidase n=1 Tax=Tahibacter aquaticus TaxID=520092 RepID=A0A4R6YWC2_9GAMM|nr:trypsin-like peptidase domain-containing protein [Tahibacter aquaticus]TDR43113.1 hypothetical protein DFR29_107121 [Tahibacter aquaticus]
MKLRSASVMLALSLVAAANAAEYAQTSSEVYRPDPASAPKQEQWRAGAAKAGTATLRLPALAPERATAVRKRNAEARQRRLQVGIGRAIASEAVDDLPRLQWQAVAGGSVARLDVASTGASALRTGLRVANWPDTAELRVAGTDYSEQIYAVDGAAAKAQAGADGVYWTAVTDGELQHLELFVPANVDPATVVLNVDAVSHLLLRQQAPEPLSKALGDSESCNVDVVCLAGTLGANFTSVKNAVARMLFQSGGSTYTCSGTLINDLVDSSQIPWFFTAHHCIGNQSEASSLVTFWNNETPSCGSDQNGPNIQVGGGAQLSYSQSTTDGALLRLNGNPPAGAVLAGWSANPLTPNSAILGIHHPSGDIKKASRGTHSGVTDNLNLGGQLINSTLRASWSSGTTEGGSSGSGLFTLGSNGYQLRGGLYGGRASCSNSGLSEAAGNVDYYSRFDQIYPSIQQFLGAAASNGPTRDYTGQWDLSSESGRGLSMFQFNQLLFALWFVYDGQGRASWYQLDPAWTGVDVASGRVVRWTGSPWGPNYNPDARQLTNVGTFTLTFTSATQANFSYNVDGVNRSIVLSKISVN